MKFFRLWLSLWVPVSACGVPSTCWKVTVTTTPAPSLRASNPFRFVLWKDNAFFKRLGKRLDSHVADKLLRDGRVRLKECRSAKGKTYNATVLLSCEADGRSKFSLEFENGGR